MRHTIQKAHELGLKVLLKPHIDLYDDPEHWRGQIGKYFTNDQWKEWFSEYEKFLIHYAKLATEENVEMFSLGCELIATSKRDFEWRQIAKSVRQVFYNNITYSSNWGGEETNKTWWDVVDVIGVDAYYPLAPTIKSPTLENLVDFWKIIVEKGVANGVNGGYMRGGLKNLTTYWKKPIVFTEVGACSGNCTTGPEVDLGYQYLRYLAVFEAFKDVEWFLGTYWWNWASDPAFGGEDNFCMTPQFKPVEKLLRDWYGSYTQEAEKPNFPAKCKCIL